MSVIQLLILGITLFIVPTIIGSFFVSVDKSAKELPFMWISGQVLLWAGFQFICVPLILLEKNFHVAVTFFSVYMCLLVLLSGTILLIRYFKKRQKPHVISVFGQHSRKYYVLWAVFAILLLFQLVQTVLTAYGEGDDAFYIAISTVTTHSDTMYLKHPYTGSTTGLDARHGLAPFPVWISYLAKISGAVSVTVAQIIVPITLIMMAYALYYLIGKRMLNKRPHLMPAFMIFVALGILFGGYSVYSSENFLLVRTSQGKAVIANIIIPFLLLLLLMLLEKIQNVSKVHWLHWGLLLLTMVAGCLCSTLGTLLTCMIIGIIGCCAAICYRKWKILLPFAACCIIPALYALLYFLLD